MVKLAIHRGSKFVAKNTFFENVDQVVIFEGIQKTGFADFPDFPIYTLTRKVDSHPEGSTISRMELKKYGYVLPEEAP